MTAAKKTTEPKRGEDWFDPNTSQPQAQGGPVRKVEGDEPKPS